MSIKTICVGIGALALLGGLAACGSGGSGSHHSVAPASTPTAGTPTSAPPASTATTSVPADNGTRPDGSILDNDLGAIQDEDMILGPGSSGQPASYWEPLVVDGKKLAADAAIALDDPMPPVDPADYRAAAEEYYSAGIYMSKLDFPGDYNAATKAANGYFTSWINSWDS